MATEQVVEEQHEDSTAYAGVLRFYELAKRAEWQVRDMPWGEIPPIPETTGTPQKIARRRDMWRSVVTQQLQADELACEMASQLLNIAPDHEAKLYYSTMVQDESRHTEAWLRLSGEIGGTGERDPHLDGTGAIGADHRHTGQRKFEGYRARLGESRACDPKRRFFFILPDRDARLHGPACHAFTNRIE